MNNKNHIKICTVSVCYMICIMLTACNKYLDKKQNAAESVPSTLNDLQALMDADNMTSQGTPSYPEASADEYYLTSDIFNSYPESLQYIYTWKHYVFPDNTLNDWRSSYYPVYNTNLVLDLINGIDRNPKNAQAWDNVKGIALFYRAYNFLNLCWEYSKAYDSSTAGNDLGIVLRLTSDFNVPSVRATVQKSYEQIINDARAAIPLLPDYPLVLTRPSKGAAYGLLARCYLSMRDYKDALVYADSCLQLNGNLIDFNGDADMTNPINGDVPFKQYNKETVFYSIMNYNYDIYSYVGDIDTSVIELYQPSDLRKTAFIGNNAGETYFKAPYSGSLYTYFTGIATDEMYLVRAECYIRNGQVQKGLDDINTLLVKRYKTGTRVLLTGLSQSDALLRVLSERRKELLFRGNRWIDIKRLNKEGENIVLKRDIGGQVFTLEPNDNFYALPLPDDLTNTTDIPQNAP